MNTPDEILESLDGALDSLPAPRPSARWPAPLGPAAYHGIAGDVVKTIEPHSESDPAAILVQFLAA